MPKRVRLTDEALLQIVSISDYIAKDSKLNARRWRAGLRKKIKSLDTLPERHAIVYTAQEAGREVRQTFFGVYHILYTIEPAGVVVLTVRHGAQKPIGPTEIEGIE